MVFFGRTSEYNTEPEIALIFVLENSIYGQPHQEILDRMEKAGTMIPATKDCGAVRLIPEKSGVKSGTFIDR